MFSFTTQPIPEIPNCLKAVFEGSRCDCNKCRMHDSNLVERVLGKSDMKDKIYSPEHYQSKAGLEVIDVIEAFELNFNLGNVIKYILRAGKKDDHCQDLKKALWYLRREIGNVKQGEGDE